MYPKTEDEEYSAEIIFSRFGTFSNWEAIITAGNPLAEHGTQGSQKIQQEKECILKILVVDDEIMQLKGIKIGLRTEGHAIVTALSAEEALASIKADPLPFDLIITDYLMANMNGLDLLKEVRKEGLFIPVLLMTAYGRKDLLIEAMQHQCSGCIEKPFTFEQLLTEIARIKEQTERIGNTRASTETLAHIVHQINNPLCAIIGNVEMAKHNINNSKDVNTTWKQSSRPPATFRRLTKKF